jgi:hypothetical protein
MVAAEAVNVAEVAPTGTVRVPGTVNRVGRLLDRETATPPAGAALERVTVHVVFALDARLALAHSRPESVTGETSASVAAAAEPFNVAVTVAV